MTQTPVEEKPPYEALDFEGSTRRANYRVIAFREDILHILDRNEGAAMIYNILERWEERHKDTLMVDIGKRKKAGAPPLTQEDVESQMWTYMSYNDFVRESGGALGYNTVIRLLNFLIIDKKVLKQRANRDPKYSDYEYRIDREAVANLLKELPSQPAFTPKVPKKKSGSTHLGTADNQSTHLGTGSTQEGIASTQMGTEVYPFGGTSHITHSIHNNHKENSRGDDVASASHHEGESSFSSGSPTETGDNTDNPLTRQPTDDMPVLQPSQETRTETPDSLEGENGTDISRVVDSALNAKSIGKASNLRIGKDTTGKGSAQKPDKPAKPQPSNLIELTTEQEERAKAWGPRIDKWRGYALETKGAVVNEKQCIRKLVKRYTDEQIKRVYVYLFKKHWRWSKAENRYKIGANEVWQEASAVLQELEGTVPAELNEMQQPGKPADAKSIMDALTATSSYQPLQFASRPARKAQ